MAGTPALGLNSSGNRIEVGEAEEGEMGAPWTPECNTFYIFKLL